ncbi:hypothetical protein Tco_0584151 [Tanacetum coccineum]
MAEDNALFDLKMALLPVKNLRGCLNTFEACGLTGEAVLTREFPKDEMGQFLEFNFSRFINGRSMVLASSEFLSSFLPPAYIVYVLGVGSCGSLSKLLLDAGWSPQDHSRMDYMLGHSDSSARPWKESTLREAGNHYPNGV